MSVQEQYSRVLTTPAEAVTLVRNDETIIVPTGAGEPPELLEALSEQRRTFQSVKISQILALKNFGYFDPDTTEHVRHAAFFFGPASRMGGQQGWSDFIPNNFSELPEMMRRGQIPGDVVFALASPMNADGYFSLGLSADYTMAAIAKARIVVLEVNPNVPFTYGACHVHVAQVAALVESNRPVTEVGMPCIGPVQEMIGKYVAEHIEDGSTLQIGYGGIPDAVVLQLSSKKNLGIHSEMIGDGIRLLAEAGAIDGSRKSINQGKIIGTFVLGSEKLYRFVDRNPMVELHPCDVTNDPYLACQNSNLMAINGSLEVDLLGQCGSESLGPFPYSGSGGQTDFVRAANRSKGGKAFIVLPSTAKNGTVSRIALTLSAGTHVTTSKNDVNYVVTEYGVAQLRGKSAKQRARELISIAHPDFRAELTAGARKFGLF